MYTAEEREGLLRQIIDFIQRTPEFEGLLQIGSGVSGFSDIYSDIDLMAGCYQTDSVMAADAELVPFFHSLGASYINKRAWTKTALGLSVYFANGLSVDISYMPTAELVIRSPQWEILIAKTEIFSSTAAKAAMVKARGPDDSIHYDFIRELRYVQIALSRNNGIYADIALNRARQILLNLQTFTEGKKNHQFKAYHTLDRHFLERLERTYPAKMTAASIQAATENLLTLYLDTVDSCAALTFDQTLLSLLSGFNTGS